MRAALAKEAAPCQTVSSGSRMEDFRQDAGGMVSPADDNEDGCSSPSTAENENDADAGAVADLVSDAKSMQKELDKESQACRRREEATANDGASEVNGSSHPSRLREADLVSICEDYVARSVGTEAVAAAMGGASSAAGSGRGPHQANVLLMDAPRTQHVAVLE